MFQCCALSFIETMTAESVSMDPEEFDSYFSGRAVPPGSWQSSLLMCEGLQAMAQNLKTLQELRGRHDKVLRETIKLKEEMSAFQEEISAEVKAVLERTQYEIRGPRPPAEDAADSVASSGAATVDLDALEDPGDLPSPMAPRERKRSSNSPLFVSQTSFFRARQRLGAISGGRRFTSDQISRV